MRLPRLKTRHRCVNPAFLVVLALITILPLPLHAAVTELTFSTTALHCGIVEVDRTRTVVVFVTNHGKSDVKISTLSSSNSEFKVSKVELPKLLGAGKRLQVSITFVPTGVGPVSGHITVLSNASNPTLTLPVFGTGESTESKRRLTIAPATLSFGNVGVGTTETLTLGLSATGESVTISSVSSSNSQFTVPGVTLPLTIPAGHELSLNVEFKPQSSGTKSAALSFTSNAQNSPASEPLSGTATSLYVTLSWNASTSQVSGYNVYRGTSAERYSQPGQCKPRPGYQLYGCNDNRRQDLLLRNYSGQLGRAGKWLLKSR